MNKPQLPVRDPRTPEEWQDAVNAARYFLIIADCTSYGILHYRGEVNLGRCNDILQRGAARGILPASLEELFPIPSQRTS